MYVYVYNVCIYGGHPYYVLIHSVKCKLTFAPECPASYILNVIVIFIHAFEFQRWECHV